MALSDYFPVTRGYLERRMAEMATREEMEQAKSDLSNAISSETNEVRERVNALVARVAELEQQVANGGAVTLEDLQGFREAVLNIHTPPA